MKNPAGQWESGKNKIPWRLAESNSILKGVRAYSLGADNFDEYGFYSATFNGESFYVLIKRFTSGSYAYPNIYKGWYDGPHYFAYALTSQEAGKLRNIANGENNRILIKYFDFQFFDMKDQRDAIESIKKLLAHKIRRKELELSCLKLRRIRKNQSRDFKSITSSARSRIFCPMVGYEITIRQ